jgi:hypothetical protein
MKFRGLLGTAGGLFLLALISAGSGNGADSAVARPPHLVGSTHQECREGVNCESEQQDMVTIPAGAREQFIFTCSQQDPYLQSWDAAQHRYIELGVAGFTPGSVTLIAKNVGLKPGSFIVTLGCMLQASASTDYMGSKGYKYKVSQPPRERRMLRSAELPASDPVAPDPQGRAEGRLGVVLRQRLSVLLELVAEWFGVDWSD